MHTSHLQESLATTAFPFQVSPFPVFFFLNPALGYLCAFLVWKQGCWLSPCQSKDVGRQGSLGRCNIKRWKNVLCKLSSTKALLQASEALRALRAAHDTSRACFGRAFCYALASLGPPNISCCCVCVVSQHLPKRFTCDSAACSAGQAGGPSETARSSFSLFFYLTTEK